MKVTIQPKDEKREPTLAEKQASSATVAVDADFDDSLPF
jgi:hypothetical protein